MAEKYRNVSVFGNFPDRQTLEGAITLLRGHGFRSSDLSLLAPEGAVAGAGTATAMEGILGWLTGVGTLAIPGSGLFVAAGPLMGMLAGVGLGGGLSGVTGALVGAGMSEYEAERVVGAVRQEEVLMAVHCDDQEWTSKAKALLAKAGAGDISSTTLEETYRSRVG